MHRGPSPHLTQAGYSGASAEMTPNQNPESRDSSPAHRPNARTSCDLCKRMKIKCERQGETCLHCIDRGAKCETTLVERKKRQVKRVDPGSIIEMENRIKRLESVIVASGLNAQLNEESPEDENDTPSPHTTHLTDRLSTLLIDEEGSSSFLGSSSGFSMFSPQGLQWISERTGSNELPNIIKTLSKAKKVSKLRTKTELWCPLLESSREPLPPRHVADQWVQCFFETFNTMLPLYDREIFDKYYVQQYSDKPPPGAAWYASVNVVIAIGGMIWEVHRGKVMDDKALDFSNTQYSKYFRNAASCFIDLSFKETSLMAVQAMCGMAFLQQMSLEPQPSHVLTHAAGRMAYAIGLHRKLDEVGLSELEINQRRNVFWIVYIMDKVLALRLGHPSVMNDNDIGVDLPKEHKKFSCNQDGSQRYDIFRCQVQLALLESRIYTELYSARAHKRSPLERLRSVGQIDKELQEWRMAVPVEIRPDEFIRCSQEQFPPVFLMHFEYFNCISTIHRVSVHHRGPWTNDDLAQAASTPHNPKINPRVYSSQSICLSAARSTIKLLQYIDVVDRFRFDRFIWTEMYYPLSAFILLFANIVHNPEDPYVASDLQLMDLVISVLSPMIGHTGPFNATAALHLFQELQNIAKKFVEGKGLQQTRKAKRGYDSDFPKDSGTESCAVTPQPVDATPQPQKNVIPSFMPYITQPLQTNIQQYGPQSFDEFGDASFIPEAPPMIPLEDMGFPMMGFDPFTFSENFQYDLANLWNQDYSPKSQKE